MQWIELVMLENIEVGYFCQSNFEKLAHSNDFLYESLNKSRLSKLCNYDPSLIKINDICNNHLTNYLSIQIYDFYNNYVCIRY